jgi:hypothetical protein
MAKKTGLQNYIIGYDWKIKQPDYKEEAVFLSPS